MDNSMNLPSLNIAHRGARSVAPENTLAAAQKAVDFGADMWELDVAVSADGIPFLLHDDTLTRTSNVRELFPDRSPWLAHEFTWAEIRQLDFGSWFEQHDPLGEIAAGNVSRAELDSYRGLPAPTLEESLLFTRDHQWRVNVEIKDLQHTPHDGEVVEKVVNLIERLDMVDAVLLSSFNYRYLKRVKTACSKLDVGVLVSQPTPDPFALLKPLSSTTYHPEQRLIQPHEIAQLRQAGVAVNVWTVNEMESMRTLIKAGATGIITDFPQRLKALR